MATSLESRNIEDCQYCENTTHKAMNQNSIRDRTFNEYKRNEHTSAGKSFKIRDGENTSNKLFPNPEKFQLRSQISSSSSGSQTKISISKKPLRCPYLDCGKFVGVFDISAHFKYEHKEVPHISTNFDVRNALEFSPKDVKRGGLKTMLLLNLDNSKEVSSSFVKENQTLLVLATKLAEYDVEEKLRDKSRRQRSDERKDTDKWIFWLGSNISTNFSYTIAISTLDNETRLKYFGPAVHLEEDPCKLWGNGKCLLLNRFQIEKMSENFHKNLNLDIIIYSDE